MENASFKRHRFSDFLILKGAKKSFGEGGQKEGQEKTISVKKCHNFSQR